MNSTDKICEDYVGVACVDRSCPIANADTYEEYGMDVIRKCEDCWMYRGCEDCLLSATEGCDLERGLDMNDMDIGHFTLMDYIFFAFLFLVSITILFCYVCICLKFL